MSPYRVLYADGTLGPGGTVDKCQENCVDDLPSITGDRGTGRQGLYLVDDGGGGGGIQVEAA